MPFSGPQLRALSDALLAAFPDYNGLRQMVRFGLDANLNGISSSPNIRTAVFDLVEWAEAQDKLLDLLRAAQAANPDNPALRAVAAQLVPAPTRPASTRPASSAPLIVDAFGRGDFATIAAALAAAPPGARILVRPGLYEEALLIDKPVEIAGDGPLDDIEVRATGAPAIRFRAKVGRVINLTLRQAGAGQYAVDIEQGRLDLEGCDISSAGLSCVAIHSGASPRLRGNRIHDGKSAGVLVYENGAGLLENNDIFANASVGVAIQSGGNPTLRGNRIYDGKSTGVMVYENGGGLLDNNDIFANALAGVGIKIGGNPTLRANRIHDGKSAGVLVWENGTGLLENNDIFANASAGVEIRTGGNPTARANRINKNGYQAVWVDEGGGGTFEDNDLRGNPQGAWLIADESLPRVSRARNQE